MTHESEDDFTEVVERWLTYHYGEDNVAREVTLPTRRRPDYVVETPVGKSLAVEVENEARLTYESVGQALAYANELGDVRGDEYVPVVVLPTHAVRGAGNEYLAREVEVVVLEVDWSPPA
jgi:hypothetical protein